VCATKTLLGSLLAFCLNSAYFVACQLLREEKEKVVVYTVEDAAIKGNWVCIYIIMQYGNRVLL
jgi:hypothetical protein